MGLGQNDSQATNSRLLQEQQQQFQAPAVPEPDRQKSSFRNEQDSTVNIYSRLHRINIYKAYDTRDFPIARCAQQT